MNPSTKAVVLLALILTAVACAGTDANKNGPDVADLTATDYSLPASAVVQVAPNAPALDIGQTVKLATAFVDGAGRPVEGVMGVLARWRSSDTTIATVSVTGVVKGLKDGHVTITAMAGRRVASSFVTVRHRPTTSTEQQPDTGKSVAQTDAATTTAPTAAPAKPETPATSTPATTTPATTPTKPPTVTPPPPASAPPVAAAPPTAPAPISAPISSPQTGIDGPSLSGNAFVSDDYRSYANTAALIAKVSVNVGGTGSPQASLYTDGPNAGTAQLDPAVTYNGHPTVRYDQRSGTTQGPEMWVGFPNGKTLTNMWLRAVIRFSPGFTTLGTTPNSANAYKLLGWSWAGTNGRGGLGFTNTTDYTFTWGVQSYQGANLGFTEPTGFRKVTTEWSDGAWYDYVIHYQQISATTTRTSFYLGRNNSTPQLVYTMDGAINPGSAIPPVNGVMLGLDFELDSYHIAGAVVWPVGSGGRRPVLQSVQPELTSAFAHQPKERRGGLSS